MGEEFISKRYQFLKAAHEDEQLIIHLWIVNLVDFVIILLLFSIICLH